MAIMIKVLLSYTPLVIGVIFSLYALGSLLALPKVLLRFWKRLKNKSAKSQAVQTANPLKQLLLIIGFSVGAYGSFVFGAINFPVDGSFYAFSICEKNHLNSNLSNGQQLRLKHVVAAQNACKKSAN